MHIQTLKHKVVNIMKTKNPDDTYRQEEENTTTTFAISTNGLIWKKKYTLLTTQSDQQEQNHLGIFVSKMHYLWKRCSQWCKIDLKSAPKEKKHTIPTNKNQLGWEQKINNIGK